MYSTSLRHNIEVRDPRVEQYHLSFHEIHVLKSSKVTKIVTDKLYCVDLLAELGEC